MKPARLLLTALALGVAVTGNALADSIRLKNGSALVGTVTKTEGGKIYFSDSILGALVLNEADVTVSKSGSTVAPTPSEVAGESATAASAPTAGPAISVAASAGSANFQGQAKDPNKPVWTNSFSVGGSYNSALFEQGQLQNAPPGVTGAALKLPGRTYGVQASLSFMRTTQTDAHSLDFAQTLSDSEPNGRIADNFSGVFAWNHKLTERTYTASRSSYTIDNVKNIDYSAIQLFGYGYKVVNTLQAKFDVIPGILLMREKKGNQYDGETIVGAGFAESFFYYFNPYAAFEQKMLYRRSIKDSDLYVFDAYIGFKGMLSANLGLTVGVSYVYDNTLGPLPAPYSFIIAQKKDLIQTTYGLQYKF